MPKKTPAVPEPAADAVSQENADLKAQLTAQAGREDRMLDMLAEMQSRLDSIEGRPQAGPSLSQVEAELTAELEALKADPDLAAYPLMDVFEQRVVLGTEASIDIRLVGDPSVMADPIGQGLKWKLRWFNFGKEGRAEQMAREGYEKVRRDELQNPEAIPALANTDEYVRRGDRGLEVLGKIPMKLYAYKKKRDAARQQGLIQSEGQMRDHVANKVASLAGASGDNASQAGDFAHQGISMSITQGAKETVTL